MLRFSRLFGTTLFLRTNASTTQWLSLDSLIDVRSPPISSAFLVVVSPALGLYLQSFLVLSHLVYGIDMPS
jgi:hypothetical protein